MPINHCIGRAMHGFKHRLSRLAAKIPRQKNPCAPLGVNHLHDVRFLHRAIRTERRQLAVVRMAAAIIPFLHRRKHKPRHLPDAADRFHIGSHAPRAGQISIYQSVERTQRSLHAGSADSQSVGFITKNRSPVAAPAADNGRFHLLQRRMPLPLAGQQARHLKQIQHRQGERSQAARQLPGLPGYRSIPRPQAGADDDTENGRRQEIP